MCYYFYLFKQLEEEKKTQEKVELKVSPFILSHLFMIVQTVSNVSSLYQSSIQCIVFVSFKVVSNVSSIIIKVETIMKLVVEILALDECLM